MTTNIMPELVTETEHEAGDAALAIDPEVMAERSRQAAFRLRELAAEVREQFAILGQAYTFSKTVRPMSKRYQWRDAASLDTAGRPEEQRMAARWSNERRAIEQDMGVPPLAFNPKSILTAYGAWKAKKGKRKRSGGESQDLLARLPSLYVVDEVDFEHRDLGAKTLAAVKKAVKEVTGEQADWRMVMAAAALAQDAQVREAATNSNMDASTAADMVDVGMAVDSQQRRRAYEQDGHNDF